MSDFSGKDLTQELSPQESSAEQFPDNLLNPIPLDLPKHSSREWTNTPLEEGGEPLVPLGPFSEYSNIFTSSVYAGEHNASPYVQEPFEGSTVTVFVREGVADRLIEAQKLLPERYYLVVYDAQRTIPVQASLHKRFIDDLREQHPDWTEEALITYTANFVSLPSTDEAKPSPHNTGGSVDLLIFRLSEEADKRIKEIDSRLARLSDRDVDEAYMLEMEKNHIFRHGEELDFGTDFDHGGPRAALNYFEALEQERPLTPDEVEARDDRRALYNVMVAVGMVPFDGEWWHYNAPESQMGAWASGRDHASYGGVSLSEANLAHEKMRAMHHQGTVKIQEGLMEGRHLHGKVDPNARLIRLNEQALEKTGDPRITHLTKSEIIAPPEEDAEAA